VNENPDPSPVPCEFDHLVVGAHTLEQGGEFIEKLIGVAPQAGGRHVAMGTHNKVLRLGARAYLEIIAIDPAGDPPPRPRWFGLDDKRTQQRLRLVPRLLTWAARTTNIDKAVAQCPVALGAIHPMARGEYQWRITIADNGTLACHGLLPALIQWDCATHPAKMLDDCGCDLVKIEGLHPAPGRIRESIGALGLGSIIELRQRSIPQLSATIRTRRGKVTITS
jgi:hypothetical protein